MRYLFLCMLIGLVLVILAAAPAQAMPEYAARVGEPCASCHVSPSGGGLRNLRGQAWVASGRPAVVPSTSEALRILGITLPSDTSDYETGSTPSATPSPFAARPAGLTRLMEELQETKGN